jgi:putative phosphoribosyl transferase
MLFGYETSFEIPFKDRADAGRRLSSRLSQFTRRDDVLVLALPRGGVPVGFEIAHALMSPLDILVVRKLGVPGQEELAMGAIASGGILVINSHIVHALRVSKQQVDDKIAHEQRELERREHLYRGDRRAPDIHGRTVILVDDGVATGSTMQAAISAVRQQNPALLIVAVPVAANSVCQQLDEEADSVVCLYTPVDLYAVGQWYRSFTQTTDDEVHDLLDRAIKPAQQPVA